MDRVDLPCDVHGMVNGDWAPRATQYCSLCDSNICAECWPKYDWRGIAAMKTTWKRVKDLLGRVA